jgi:hypothetical protein
VDFRTAQKLVDDNKIAKGFNRDYQRRLESGQAIHANPVEMPERR